MRIHRLEATPETVHWGQFDARLKPVLTIDPGDRVEVTTVSGGPQAMPPAPFVVPEALRRIHAAVEQRLPGHICTGPIAVRGARAGQVLEVRIHEIGLHYDWGYNTVVPGFGAVPDAVTERRLSHIPLDRARMVARLKWGAEIPLRPFFGVMAVAPPLACGEVSTLPPRRVGGNIDNKELTAGSTLFLPIAVDGALFSIGDGHAAQGDGEVCETAIETGLTGTVALHLRDDMTLEWPLAETATHMITMAFDPDLDRCVTLAVQAMIALLGERAGLSAADAYMLCSLAADVRVTQAVNPSKGAHVMLDKRYFDRRGSALGSGLIF